MTDLDRTLGLAFGTAAGVVVALAASSNALGMGAGFLVTSTWTLLRAARGDHRRRCHLHLVD
jgi:uncharacterized membrane protein required for colicin V production